MYLDNIGLYKSIIGRKDKIIYLITHYKDVESAAI
jgi:hypothetical protein